MRTRAILYWSIFWAVFTGTVFAQQTLLDIDTTRGVGKMFLSVFKKYDQLRFSGYIQTQFQWTQTPGAANYSGGDFAPQSDNRFMIRRGRMRMDYAGYNEAREPNVYFIFQFDGTERGVFIRDFWGRIFETYWHSFSLTTGMFARPMGYELSLSSSDRESPERGRMSQILMPTERDLGVMVTFQAVRGESFPKNVRLDLGVFNGQGLSAPAEFDSRKDVIGRVMIQPVEAEENLYVSGSLSAFFGGVAQGTKYKYEMGKDASGAPVFLVDSSNTNLHAVAPRRYYNGDVQIRYTHGWGDTELRVEYLVGVQPGSFTTTRIDSKLPSEPLYLRNFDGAYITLLQNIISPRHQLILKYDWYDPNTEIGGRSVGVAGNGTGAADIRYETFGIGYIFYANTNLKWVLYYDRIVNEPSSAAEYKEDLKDDIFTCRLQFRF